MSPTIKIIITDFEDESPFAKTSLNICSPIGKIIIVKITFLNCHKIVEVKNVEASGPLLKPFLLRYQYPIPSPPIASGVMKETIEPIIELKNRCFNLTFCP